MGTTTMVIVGFLTAFEFLYIIYSMNQDYLLIALGYKMYLDTIFGLGTTVYFALSGTIAGIAIAAYSGAIFSLSLYLAAKVLGYKKYVKNPETGERELESHAPEWNLKSIGQWSNKAASKFQNAANDIQAGFEEKVA